MVVGPPLGYSKVDRCQKMDEARSLVSQRRLCRAHRPARKSGTLKSNLYPRRCDGLGTWRPSKNGEGSVTSTAGSSRDMWDGLRRRTRRARRAFQLAGIGLAAVACLVVGKGCASSATKSLTSRSHHQGHKRAKEKWIGEGSCRRGRRSGYRVGRRASCCETAPFRAGPLSQAGATVRTAFRRTHFLTS